VEGVDGGEFAYVVSVENVVLIAVVVVVGMERRSNDAQRLVIFAEGDVFDGELLLVVAVVVTVGGGGVAVVCVFFSVWLILIIRRRLRHDTSPGQRLWRRRLLLSENFVGLEESVWCI